MDSFNSGSISDTGRELFWGNIAQQSGTAQTDNVPQSIVCKGKLIKGNFWITPLFSRAFITIGGNAIHKVWRRDVD